MSRQHQPPTFSVRLRWLHPRELIQRWVRARIEATQSEAFGLGLCFVEASNGHAPRRHSPPLSPHSNLHALTPLEAIAPLDRSLSLDML